MKQIKTFTITDSDGVEHSYECTQHPGDVGFDLMLSIQAMVGEAFGMSRSSGALEAVVESVAKSGGLILARGGHEFVLGILAHTKRDGQKIDRALFRSAYQGNYNEVVKALGVVVAHNWGGVGKLVGDLASSLQGENAQQRMTDSVASALGLDLEALTGAIGKFSTDTPAGG